LDNPSSTHPEYILHAVLLCRSAIRTWPVESLDKFLIGDLGDVPLYSLQFHFLWR
jgi:hypothetical protein